MRTRFLILLICLGIARGLQAASAPPPETLLLSGPADATDETVATFAFQSDQPSSSFECRVDNKEFSPCAGVLTLEGMEFGTHAFEVRAVNPLGIPDPSPARHEWEVFLLTPSKQVSPPTRWKGLTEDPLAKRSDEFEVDPANSGFLFKRISGNFKMTARLEPEAAFGVNIQGSPADGLRMALELPASKSKQPPRIEVNRFEGDSVTAESFDPEWLTDLETESSAIEMRACRFGSNFFLYARPSGNPLWGLLRAYPYQKPLGLLPSMAAGLFQPEASLSALKDASEGVGFQSVLTQGDCTKD
jgi:hypothetical protein